MERSPGCEEKRRFSRFVIDLPLDYQEMDNSRVRGAILVNASEAGLLIEAIHYIPVGAKVNVAVLFPKEFELDDLILGAQIVWNEPRCKEDWDGYQYGVNIIQMFAKERQALKSLLSSI